MKFTAGAAGPSMNFPLVKGSPYLTAQIPSPAKPVLKGGTITNVARVGPSKLKILVGSVPYDGQHTWLVWASQPVNYAVNGAEVSISAQAATDGTFAGVLRVAWVPNAGTAGAAAVEAMLDAHVDAVPVGGSVKVWTNGQNTGSYTLAWSVKSMSGAAAPTQELLTLALPHHIDTLAAPAAAIATASPVGVFPLGVAAAGSGVAATGGSAVYTSNPQSGSSSSYSYGGYLMSVRGPMVPVVGSCWQLQESLLAFTTEVQAAANLKSAAWRANIEQTLLVSVSTTAC